MLGLACQMNFSSQRFYVAVTLLFGACLGMTTGCASPGTPRAPSLQLPQRVTGATAERHGASVTLRFTTPTRSSDGLTLTAPVTATLCRAVAGGACVAPSGFTGKKLISGPVEWVDALPPELAAGNDRLLAYRVELFNQHSKSAGPSDRVFAAAGQAPPGVEGLRAEGSRAGVILRWTPVDENGADVLVKRDDLNAGEEKKTAPAKKSPLPGKKVGGGRKARTAPSRPAFAGSTKQDADGSEWLRAPQGAKDAGGIVDGTAHADEPYRYMAVRRRSVKLDGHDLELRSENSAAVETTLRDTYPPATPRDVQVTAFPVPNSDALAADMVWQPGAEQDLAGYNVYRRTVAADGTLGLPVKLNAKAVVLPAFHDATIVRGVGYRYTVTAIDSKGNESAASAAAELTPTP